MTSHEILEYCIENLPGTVEVESWGEKGIYYNPDKILKRGVYILTIKENDGENDRASNLNRDGVFRINIGIKKATFIKLFGEIPVRPSAGNVVNMDYNFQELNKIIPHPVYAWMSWVSALNPEKSVFSDLMPLITEAYEYAVEKYNKKYTKEKK